MSHLFNLENYKSAKKNGLEKQFRGDEISRRISLEIPSNEQQALQTNMIDDLINGRPLSRLEKWEKYQSVRARVETEVDKEISKFEEKI